MARHTAQRLIDTHLHVLQPSRWHYHWLTAGSPLDRDVMLTDLEPVLAASGVYSGVLIEATNTPEEITHLLDISAASPLQPGVIGWLPADYPDTAQEIARLARHPSFKGIRLNGLSAETPALTLTLKALEAHSLVVDLLTQPNQLAGMAHLIAAHPGLWFVLDHMGGLDLSQPAPHIWHEQLRPLADLPNVIGKISGFGGLPAPQRTISLRALVEVAADLFGSERLMFGSNVPFGLDQTSYADMVHSLDEAVQTLPAPAQEDIFAKTAARIYRLPLPSGVLS